MTDVGRQLRYWEGQKERKRPDDPVIAAFVRPKLDWLLARVTLPESPSILDVGCGNGYFTHYLERVGTTVGLDYAAAMLRMNPAPRRVLGSALALPFVERAFNLVLCSNLLHHLAEPVAAVAEMGRVSRRYVVLSEPNRNNPAMLALGLVKKEERATLHFTRSRVEGFARAAGLDVLAAATMGFVTPNRMPRWAVRLASGFDAPNPLGAYSVVVAERRA